MNEEDKGSLTLVGVILMVMGAVLFLRSVIDNEVPTLGGCIVSLFLLLLGFGLFAEGRSLAIHATLHRMFFRSLPFFAGVLFFTGPVVMVVLSALALTPLTGATTNSATTGLLGSKWSIDTAFVDVPPGVAVTPSLAHEIGGEKYWLTHSEFGDIFIQARHLDLEYLTPPFSVRLGWVLGWRLFSDEKHDLAFCYRGQCYLWTSLFMAGLHKSPRVALAISWIFIFAFLSATRFGHYGHLHK